jgi:hypothetical protein
MIAAPALILAAAWYWLSRPGRNPKGAGFRDKSGKFHPIRNSEYYQPSLLDEPEEPRPAAPTGPAAPAPAKPRIVEGPSPIAVEPPKSGPEPSGLYWPFAKFDRARQEWRLVFPKAARLQSRIDLLNAVEQVEKFQAQVEEGQADLNQDQWRAYTHLRKLFSKMSEFIYERDKALEILRAIDIDTEGDDKGMGPRAQQAIYERTQEMSRIAALIGAPAGTVPIRSDITNEEQERDSWQVWGDNQATTIRTKKRQLDDMIKERVQRQFIEASRLRQEQQRAELAAIKAANEARMHAQRAMAAELGLDERLSEIADALHPSLDADAKKLSAALLAADAAGDETAAYHLINTDALKLVKRSVAAWKKDGITDMSRTGQAELAKAVAKLEVSAQVSLSGADFLAAVDRGSRNGLQGLNFYATARVFTAGNKINVESTDGIALSRGSAIAAIIHALDVIVPGKQLAVVARAMGKVPVIGLSVAKIGTKDSLILTDSNGRREVITAEDIVFPSKALDTVIKQSTDWRSSVDSDALGKAIKKWAPIFKDAGRDTAAIALTPTNGGVRVVPLKKVLVQSAVYGRFGTLETPARFTLAPVRDQAEVFAASTTGTGSTMTFSVARVLDAIKGIRGKLKISAGKSNEAPLKFESVDGNSVTVLMPMFGTPDDYYEPKGSG